MNISNKYLALCVFLFVGAAAADQPVYVTNPNGQKVQMTVAGSSSKLPSIAGSINLGHVAVFGDASGTVQDGGSLAASATIDTTNAANISVTPAGASAVVNMASRAAYTVYADDFRQPSDPAGDDTGPIQRACNAVSPNGGQVLLLAKVYNISQIVIGSTDATNQAKCDLIGVQGWNGYVTSLNPNVGAVIKQLPQSNESMIVINSGAAPVEMRNLLIGGSSASQTCTVVNGSPAIVDMPDYTVVSGHPNARSVNMYNVLLRDACGTAIHAGNIRNAGVLFHTTILSCASDCVLLASNNDWRFWGVDIGGSAKAAFHCAGCGSFFSAGSDFFTSLNGIKIERAAFDLTILGGSIDTNQQDGVFSAGNLSTVSNYPHVFTGVRFNENGLAANNTYADINSFGDPALSVVNSYFIKGSAAATGGNYEKYLITFDSSSKVIWTGNNFAYGAGGTGVIPYQTDVSNNNYALLTGNGSINAAEYGGGTLDAPVNIATYNNTKNGVAIVPGDLGNRASISGVGLESGRGLNVLASGSGTVGIGNATNGPGFQVLDCGTSCINLVTADGAASGSPAIIKSVGDTNSNLTVEGSGTGGALIFTRTDGVAAGAGQAGQIISSQLASGSAITLLTSGTTYNVTSMTLTPGDWDITGNIDLVLTGATMTGYQMGSNLTTGGIGGQDTFITKPSTLTAATTTTSENIPLRTLNVSSSTIIYLVVNATFSAGTVKAYGTLRARRQP